MLPSSCNFSGLGWDILDFSKPVGQGGFGAHSEAKLVSQFMETKFLCHKMAQKSTVFQFHITGIVVDNTGLWCTNNLQVVQYPIFQSIQCFETYFMYKIHVSSYILQYCKQTAAIKSHEYSLVSKSFCVSLKLSKPLLRRTFSHTNNNKRKVKPWQHWSCKHLTQEVNRAY